MYNEILDVDDSFKTYIIETHIKTQVICTNPMNKND